MNFVDLPIQFQVEVDDVNVTATLVDEAERRLLNLAKTHNDLTGATISITIAEQGLNEPHLFQVRVVVHTWQSDLVAAKKADTMQVALRRALDAIEHQVRQKHRKYREHWKRRDIQDRRADDLDNEGIFFGAVYNDGLVEQMLAQGE